jgi:hypothetical protein
MNSAIAESSLSRQTKGMTNLMLKYHQNEKNYNKKKK